MSEILLYRPYKSQKWIGLFLLIISILSFVFATLLKWFVFVVIALWLLGCALVIYRDYSKVIAFGESEIQVLIHNQEKIYLWSNFQDAYLGVNFKGFNHLVLSSKKLNEKDVWHICNKCSISNDFFGDDETLVFYLDRNKKNEIIKLVKTKLPLTVF